MPEQDDPGSNIHRSISPNARTGRRSANPSFTSFKLSSLHAEVAQRIQRTDWPPSWGSDRLYQQAYVGLFRMQINVRYVVCPGNDTAEA